MVYEPIREKQLSFSCSPVYSLSKKYLLCYILQSIY